jgi:limonene-1,2-epoxide hydrolase
MKPAAMAPWLLLCGLGLGACAARQPTGGLPMSYQEALAATDPARLGRIAPGSAEEQEAIDRFSAFLTSLTPDGVRQRTRQVYAADAYLNDTLREVRGVGQIEAYFLRTAEGAKRIGVEVLDVAGKGGEYYFRWRMEIEHPKMAGGRPTTSIGMSHVRFDPQGQVVFHQDYWDSGSYFYAHLPVLSRLINWVKKGL